jgi:5'-3' exonuclease
MSVLLVDGDNLLTIGFFGVKNYFYKGKHFGGIYHFLNTLRRSFETYHLDKICVFWDGEDSALSRRKIYHLYKENRRSDKWTDEAESSYDYQRVRIKQYLEELYVRQGEYIGCESDDCIAHYVQNSPKEKKVIFSSDRDLAQLVSKDTQLYNPSHSKLYSAGDNIEYDHETILIENVKLVKILCGDPSDNIHGIKGMGIKRLVNYFPEMKTRQLTLSEVREQFNVLFEQDKHNKSIQNLLTGVTKLGVFGDEFFEINEKVVDLTEPILTDLAKEQINLLINETLDPEGRSYKNTMKMMMEDGMFTALPKQEDAWINFLNPFLRLTRKEKNKKIIKFKI